ncbi:hypothetical protein P22_1388 [Propionispora sp. 2/2-37]|uniref:helix-turn-helix transcriptional regulator n=1 Tax=Propionispora sp. 2/2-37 TaxID=1677858 RepID=UPI0006BB905C|nr:AraC family transcriptional regulator [Propionispora sp. 2/2-37]CUH95318.1 hypothetical protein P22_1388 [Propionispora sp. 2/2-37]
MENAMQKYKIFNPGNKNCAVCAGINSMYRTDSFQQELKIPEKVGKGYFRRIIVKPSMEIFIPDVTFYDNMVIRGSRDEQIYGLAFGLGDPFWWSVEGNEQEYELACGESCIFNRFQGESVSRYQPGQRFWGLRIEFDSRLISSWIEHLGKDGSRAGMSCTCGSGGGFYKRKYSAAVSLILHDMINCHYRDDVKRIYLEGKILELLAVYLNELTFEREGAYSPVRLSNTDMKSLHEARRLLDENIATPPTIRKLAKWVCLNEYKLKTGFKKLFGKPVHAYLIDKRLETARFLIEKKKLKITEAALLVGYNDLSYFAETFRKKYGVNPSQVS